MKHILQPMKERIVDTASGLVYQGICVGVPTEKLNPDSVYFLVTAYHFALDTNIVYARFRLPNADYALAGILSAGIFEIAKGLLIPKTDYDVVWEHCNNDNTRDDMEKRLDTPYSSIRLFDMIKDITDFEGHRMENGHVIIMYGFEE